MAKNHLFILSVIISFSAVSQNDSSFVKNKLSFSVSPHHILELYHGPSINAGIEYAVTNHFSFYSECGHFIPNLLWSDYYDLKGFSFSQEFKAFYNDDNYISFQVIYGKQEYWKEDSLTDGTMLYYDNKKEFLDLSFRYGKNMVFKNRLFINPYIGLGIRTHRLNCSLAESVAASRLLGNWNNPKNWIHGPGSKTYLKAQLGIRIGFRIL